MIQVNLMHILLIGPIMIYIGINPDNSELLKKILVGISLMIPFSVNIPKFDKLYISYHLINLFHWTVILGYFFYLSYLFVFNKYVKPYIYYSMISVGAIIIIIHLYKLIPKIFYKKKSNDNHKNHNH